MKALVCIFLWSICSIPDGTNENSLEPYQLVIFEGSDWCTNCRRFEKNILSDTNIQNFLIKHQIKLIRVDFPQRKKLSKEQEQRNEKMAERYSFTGLYPEIVLSKKDGKQFKKLSYKNETTEEFITMIQESLKSLE